MKVVKTRAKRAGPGRANVISARAGPGRATFNYLRAGPGRAKQIFLKFGPGRALFQLRPGHGPDRPVSSLNLHDSVVSFASFTRPHAQSATCLFGTHYNRRELTEPMTDENYSPYPKIGLDDLVMAHGHWINRWIDPSCMFYYDFGIFCLSPTRSVLRFWSLYERANKRTKIRVYTQSKARYRMA